MQIATVRIRSYRPVSLKFKQPKVRYSFLTSGCALSPVPKGHKVYYRPSCHIIILIIIIILSHHRSLQIFDRVGDDDTVAGGSGIIERRDSEVRRNLFAEIHAVTLGSCFRPRQGTNRACLFLFEGFKT